MLIERPPGGTLINPVAGFMTMIKRKGLQAEAYSPNLKKALMGALFSCLYNQTGSRWPHDVQQAMEARCWDQRYARLVHRIWCSHQAHRYV